MFCTNFSGKNNSRYDTTEATRSKYAPEKGQNDWNSKVVVTWVLSNISVHMIPLCQVRLWINNADSWTLYKETCYGWDCQCKQGMCHVIRIICCSIITAFSFTIIVLVSLWKQQSIVGFAWIVSVEQGLGQYRFCWCVLYEDSVYHAYSEHLVAPCISDSSLVIVLSAALMSIV